MRKYGTQIIAVARKGPTDVVKATPVSYWANSKGEEFRDPAVTLKRAGFNENRAKGEVLREMTGDSRFQGVR